MSAHIAEETMGCATPVEMSQKPGMAEPVMSAVQCTVMCPESGATLVFRCPCAEGARVCQNLCVPR